MKVSIKSVNDNFCMEAVNESGNVLKMAASKSIGGDESAFRPMQLLLSAIGGCSSIDVLSILKKQKQAIESFAVDVTGERETIEEYSLFRKINVHFKIKGNVDMIKVERAINLSLEKYCSVAKTLEPTANITYTISINE